MEGDSHALCVSVGKNGTRLARDAWEAHNRRERRICFLSFSLDTASVSANSGEAIRVVTDICDKHYFCWHFAQAVFQASFIAAFDRECLGTGNGCIPLSSSNPAELGKLVVFANINS